MNALKSASVVVCVCCIVCSIIGLISPQGTMRKILNLILGAFLICSMLIPLIGLSATFSKDLFVDNEFDNADLSSSEQAYEQLVLNQTADNLVEAANDLLLSENIAAQNIEVGIKKSENNSIYISTINIYISDDDKYKTEKIKNIIARNMSKEPVIIINE